VLRVGPGPRQCARRAPLPLPPERAGFAPPPPAFAPAPRRRRTSGSTMGTSPASWQILAYAASPCAADCTPRSEGRPAAGSMVMTPRHLAKRAPAV
jgi:hypothetical protein